MGRMPDLQRMRSPVSPFAMAVAYRNGFGRRCGGGPPDLAVRVGDDDPMLSPEDVGVCHHGERDPGRRGFPVRHKDAVDPDLGSTLHFGSPLLTDDEILVGGNVKKRPLVGRWTAAWGWSLDVAVLLPGLNFSIGISPEWVVGNSHDCRPLCG
ncbi:hypothetical protein ACLOJK_023002 [Asimina triloba]